MWRKKSGCKYWISRENKEDRYARRRRGEEGEEERISKRLIAKHDQH
jgi:hypothetical protein